MSDYEAGIRNFALRIRIGHISNMNTLGYVADTYPIRIQGFYF